MVFLVSAELGYETAVFGVFSVGVVDDEGGCCVDLLGDGFAQIDVEGIESGG